MARNSQINKRREALHKIQLEYNLEIDKINAIAREVKKQRAEAISNFHQKQQEIYSQFDEESV